MPRRPTARSGMALILTLVAIVLAGGLALFLQSKAAALSRAEQTELLKERLRLAAAEAAREVLWILASDDNLQVDSMQEEWAAPRESVSPDGLFTWAQVEDAGRFFNWNNLSVSNRATRAPHEILLDLMTFCGDFTPTVRVEALKDFLDADEEGTYESSFYESKDLSFQTPNRELWAPAELLWVHGFSADLFRSRPPPATDDLFGGDLGASTVVVPMVLKTPLPVNVNTASRDVLMGVTGLQQESALRMVMTLRQVKPFESLHVMFMANPELAAALEGSVGTASTCFRVRARAEMGNLRNAVLAWVERDSKTGDIRILQWFEEEG